MQWDIRLRPVLEDPVRAVVRRKNYRISCYDHDTIIVRPWAAAVCARGGNAGGCREFMLVLCGSATATVSAATDRCGPVWPPGYLRGNPAGGELSGPSPPPSPLVGMTPEVAGTGAGPAGSAGDVSSSPAASNGGLTGVTASKGPATDCSVSTRPDIRA